MPGLCCLGGVEARRGEQRVVAEVLDVAYQMTLFIVGPGVAPVCFNFFLEKERERARARKAKGVRVVFLTRPRPVEKVLSLSYQ